MKLSFRWYGKDDPISLEYISQIPVQILRSQDLR